MIKKYVIILTLILALPNALGLFQRSINNYKIDRNMEVAAFGDYQVKPKHYIEQRLGKPESFFFKCLAKENRNKKL